MIYRIEFFCSGKCYFKGPWLLMPTEVPHTPTKLFYKQELFLSTVDGTHPIVAIVGKSAVLEYGEYICSKYLIFSA
jgi:protein polybromo-1